MQAVVEYLAEAALVPRHWQLPAALRGLAEALPKATARTRCLVAASIMAAQSSTAVATRFSNSACLPTARRERCRAHARL